MILYSHNRDAIKRSEKKEKLNMKIKKEFYEKIKAEIANNFTNINFIKEYKDELSKNPKIKDVNKRLRWDLFYSIKPEIRIPLVDEIYQSCNDNHLDTALRHIMIDLNF